MRQLHPLWLTLTTAMPYLSRRPSSRTGDVVGYRLYRYVIEIHDGLLILEPYRDLRLEQQHPVRTPAGVAARAHSIASAVRSFSAAKSDEAKVDCSVKDQAGIDRETGELDNAMLAPAAPLLKEEVAYLTQLSRAFARLDKGS